MRFIWAGPWNEFSAIAKFGCDIVAELCARGHDVQVVRTEIDQAAALPARAAQVPIRFWQEVPFEDFRNVDAIIANFGNHYPFHGGMIHNFEFFGAIGIFHDSVLAHLAGGWACTTANGEVSLRRMATATYGQTTVAPGEIFLADLESVTTTRPMLEFYASGVAGAVVHAQHYADRVRSACAGPVAVIPMAFECGDFPLPRPISQAELSVATIGLGNPNKRVEQVIAAIASSPRLRERVRYHFIGETDPEEERKLRSLCAANRLQPPSFSGWVSDEQLHESLSNVDVIACLRYPAFEGASASLLLAMQSARPTLVSNHAAYAEVPAGLLLPCAPGNESADVTAHLEWVLDNPKAAAEMGRRAREYCVQVHTAKRYVDELLPLIDETLAARPTVLAGQALGRTLGTFGVTALDPAVARVASSLSIFEDASPFQNSATIGDATACENPQSL